MPYRSRADLSLGPLRAGRLRLEPPASGLTSREREIFIETVNALPDDHLAEEDRSLLVLYVQALARAEQANKALSEGSVDRHWVILQATSVRSAALMAQRLRIGARARDPSHRRRQGNAIQPQSLPPWGDRGPQLYAIGDDDLRGADGERSFAALRERMNGVYGSSRTPEAQPRGTLMATETADGF